MENKSNSYQQSRISALVERIQSQLEAIALDETPAIMGDVKSLADDLDKAYGDVNYYSDKWYKQLEENKKLKRAVGILADIIATD